MTEPRRKLTRRQISARISEIRQNMFALHAKIEEYFQATGGRNEELQRFYLTVERLNSELHDLLCEV